MIGEAYLRKPVAVVQIDLADVLVADGGGHGSLPVICSPMDYSLHLPAHNGHPSLWPKAPGQAGHFQLELETFMADVFMWRKLPRSKHWT